MVIEFERLEDACEPIGNGFKYERAHRHEEKIAIKITKAGESHNPVDLMLFKSKASLTLRELRT